MRAMQTRRGDRGTKCYKVAECIKDLEKVGQGGKWHWYWGQEDREERNINYNKKEKNYSLYSGHSVPGSTLSALHLLAQLPSQNDYLYSYFTTKETEAHTASSTAGSQTQ